MSLQVNKPQLLILDSERANQAKGSKKYLHIIGSKQKRNLQLILLAFLFTATAASCKDSEPGTLPKPEGDVFYIVGFCLEYTPQNSGVDTANGIGKANIYLLVPEYLKDTLYDTLFTGASFLPEDLGYALNDFLYTRYLPDTLFNFPSTIVRPFGRYFGYMVFQKEHRWKYKVRMTYKSLPAEEEEGPFIGNFFYSVGDSQWHINHNIFPKSLEQIIFIETISREEN